MQLVLKRRSQTVTAKTMMTTTTGTTRTITTTTYDQDNTETPRDQRRPRHTKKPPDHPKDHQDTTALRPNCLRQALAGFRKASPSTERDSGPQPKCFPQVMVRFKNSPEDGPKCFAHALARFGWMGKIVCTASQRDTVAEPC